MEVTAITSIQIFFVPKRSYQEESKGIFFLVIFKISLRMANFPNNIFKLRFFDNNITPESFSLKEIGELFIHLEDAIKSIVDNDFPNVNIEDIHLSPVSIENKSESILISTNNSPSETFDAIESFGEKVRSNTYINLPDKAYRGFKYIYSLAEKKQCKAEVTHKEKEVFTINYTLPIIKPESVLINVETVIYGELIKLGGDNPRAWIQLTNGNRISFSITAEQVIELGHKMRQTIAFRGKAKFNPEANFITWFTLYDVLAYKSGNISNAFTELRKLSGGSWNDIKTNDDINNFLGRSRYE